MGIVEHQTITPTTLLVPPYLSVPMRDCWPATPSEKDIPIAVLSVCFPL